MNKEKALKILGLSGNPSEEEIKKAYRKLSREHHPDNYMGEEDKIRSYHEEKMKDINAAYDYFCNKKENNIDIEDYKKQILLKIKDYLYISNDEEKLKLEPKFKDLSYKIARKIFIFSIDMESATSVKEIADLYSKLLKAIEKVCRNFKEDFYKNN